MASGKNPSRLHDRATRGETLSSTDQVALDAWYADNDQRESEQIGTPSDQTIGDLASLRAQVADAQQNLYESMERVRQISEKNEQMRQEVT